MRKSLQDLTHLDLSSQERILSELLTSSSTKQTIEETTGKSTETDTADLLHKIIKFLHLTWKRANGNAHKYESERLRLHNLLKENIVSVSISSQKVLEFRLRLYVLNFILGEKRSEL
jgi:hypothetical protein